MKKISKKAVLPVDCKKNNLAGKIKSRHRFIWISSGVFIIITAVVVSVFLYGHIDVKSATFGWLQTDWSGGASTTAMASHANNQTGWTKFFSKDANVDVTTVPGEASISATASTSVTTSNADFNTGTGPNIYVASNSISPKKPDGGSCSSASQCINGWCNASVCAYPWITGPCASLAVYYSDYGTATWGPYPGDCVGPQCATGLDTSYPSNYSLVASNAVDFTSYPARNACKTVGGRLPTMTELSCIYTNRTSYNTYGAFQSAIYWSSTEFNTASAWFVNFSSGGSGGNFKNTSYYVRCVKGQ